MFNLETICISLRIVASKGEAYEPIWRFDDFFIMPTQLNPKCGLSSGAKYIFGTTWMSLVLGLRNNQAESLQALIDSNDSSCCAPYLVWYSKDFGTLVVSDTS